MTADPSTLRLLDAVAGEQDRVGDAEGAGITRRLIPPPALREAVHVAVTFTKDFDLDLDRALRNATGKSAKELPGSVAYAAQAMIGHPLLVLQR